MDIPTFYNGRMTRRGIRELEPGSIGERRSAAFRSTPGVTPMPSRGPAALWPDTMPEVQPPPERPSYVPVQQAAPAAAPMEAAPMSAKERAKAEFYKGLSPAMAMRKRLTLEGEGGQSGDEYRKANIRYAQLLGAEESKDRADAMAGREQLQFNRELQLKQAAPLIRAESALAVQGARGELATELQRTKLASDRALLDTKGQQKLDEISATWGEKTAFTVSDSARRAAQGDANAKRDFLYEVQLRIQDRKTEEAAAMLDGYVDVQRGIAATQLKEDAPKDAPNAPIENAQATAQGLLNMAQTTQAPRKPADVWNDESNRWETPLDVNGDGTVDPAEKEYNDLSATQQKVKNGSISLTPAQEARLLARLKQLTPKITGQQQ